MKARLKPAEGSCEWRSPPTEVGGKQKLPAEAGKRIRIYQGTRRLCHGPRMAGVHDTLCGL